MLLGRLRPAWTRSYSSAASTRPRRYLRRTGYFGLGIGAIWAVDNQFNASAIARNIRTLWACALITADYKLNFTPEKSDQIPQLHERVADVMFNLFTSNGGLYIKIGQAIGANAAFLPRPMQVKFASLFDDAPQIPHSEVLSVFASEFGRPPSGPGGVFEYFENQAVASASIAQVHKARMWPEPGEEEGKWVAVKIQKPAVAKQTEWDLGAYRIVMWLFEKVAFDLPVYFVVDFVSDHLRRELDFVLEAQNAQRTAEFVAADPLLSQTVYIPRVYPALTTKRIMTAEWIEGVRLSDRDGILRLVGDLPSPPGSSAKPLQGGTRAIMEPMVELFSAQMFRWGWVHCDPHPGNVIVRPHPAAPRKPQLVLLDHGLYVQLTEEFRRDWCAVWEGLLAGEWGVVEQATGKWGVGMPDLFASAVLMRPTKLARGRPPRDPNEKRLEEMSNYERSVVMKAKLKGFLVDTDRMPKVLIFLLRNMRMVQGNNKALGSPVNRIKITGFAASRALTLTRTSRTEWRDVYHHLVFRFVMLSIDAAFWIARAKQWVWRHLFRSRGQGMGFEDEIERSVRGLAKSSFGMDVGVDAFDG